MLSAAAVNTSNQHHPHHRQLMMRPDGRCYVFPNSASTAIPNTSNLEYDEQPVSRTYQYRKVMKPMLERKRRARINRCLDELKELMLTALQSEGENVSKLEKADILELTVRHLHKLKRQRALGLTPESAYADRFLAGFTHCAAEVSQYLASAIQKQSAIATAAPAADVDTPKPAEITIDHSSGVKLLQHLGTCIQRIEHATYRREDLFNPYTTPPPSPSPNLPIAMNTSSSASSSSSSSSLSSLITTENGLGGSPWRPW